MPGPTLEGQLTLDDKPFLATLKKSTANANSFGEKLKTVFGREPVPERRAARALTELARGFTASSDAAEGFSTVAQGLMGTLKLAAPASFGVALLGTTLIKAAIAGKQSRDEVAGLERETHKFTRTAEFATSAEGLDELAGKYANLRKESRKLADETGRFSETRHPVAGMIKHLGEQLRGRESLFGGPSESEVKLTKAQTATAQQMLKMRTKITESAKGDLDITKAAVLQDSTRAQILDEQAKTEARIAQYKKALLPDEVIAQVREASALRVSALGAELAGKRIGAGEALHAARVTRPGIGLTESEVSGAQLFRKSFDIQRRIANEPNLMAKGQLMTQFLGVRNQIESAELEQFLKSTGGFGGGAGTGPINVVTAAQGEVEQARIEKQIMTAIRSNPVLRGNLDAALGSRSVFGPNPSQGGGDIGGGRTLNDLFNLIDQKWQ